MKKRVKIEIGLKGSPALLGSIKGPLKFYSVKGSAERNKNSAKVRCTKPHSRETQDYNLMEYNKVPEYIEQDINALYWAKRKDTEHCPKSGEKRHMKSGVLSKKYETMKKNEQIELPELLKLQKKM